MLCGAYVLYNK